jgi:uncharacterized protein
MKSPKSCAGRASNRDYHGTGPLVALIDQRQEAHAACVDVFLNGSLPLVTTWPCFTEAMYFAQREGGFPFQQQLWRFVTEGALRLYEPGEEILEALLLHMEELMRQYRDLPMDLADASLVALADQLNVRQIFTLDKTDFRIYTTQNGETFEIIPD